MEELVKQGLMQPAGLEIYNRRKEEKSKVASYESENKQLEKYLENKFKANKTAWDFFSKQAPSYQRTIIHWIMTAKQEPTRIIRLDSWALENNIAAWIFVPGINIYHYLYEVLTYLVYLLSIT